MRIKYEKIEIYPVERKVKGNTYTYYQADVSYEFDGNKDRKRIQRKTRKEAKQAMLDWLEKQERKYSVEVKTTTPTLAEELQVFIDEKLAAGWEPSTYRRNSDIIKNDIKGYKIATLHPLSIDRKHIISHLSAMHEKGCSVSAQDKCLSLIKNFYNHTFDGKRENPCSKIKIDYEPKLSTDQVMDKEELIRFMKKCDEFGGNADLLKFMCLTYLRIGEASTVKFSDWNQKDKTLKIQRTNTEDIEGHVIVSREGHTKTRSSTREIVLSDLANAIITERFTDYYYKYNKIPRDIYIWSLDSDRTRPVNYNVMRRLFKKILNEAHINKDITLHGIRHSSITLYAADRDNFLMVSRLAGHARTSITETIYQHTLEEHRKAAADSFNKINEIFEKDE